MQRLPLARRTQYSHAIRNNQVTPELRVALELESHEKECAVRYEMVHNKLETLDKRMWRTRSNDNGINGYCRWSCSLSINENVRNLK
jgi:hypothetical protein